MIRLKKCMVIYLTVVITMFLGAETSTLQADDDREVIKQTKEEALFEDLTLTAIANGWTIEQARANYEAAESVGRVAVELSEKKA